IFDLLVAANELKVTELAGHLQSHLIDSNASWLRLNFSRFYQISFLDESFGSSQQFCNNIIAKHPTSIIAPSSSITHYSMQHKFHHGSSTFDDLKFIFVVTKYCPEPYSSTNLLYLNDYLTLNPTALPTEPSSFLYPIFR
ncbi:16093_t:CDS:2, partial [Gigaspora rosea]